MAQRVERRIVVRPSSTQLSSVSEPYSCHHCGTDGAPVSKCCALPFASTVVPGTASTA
jgi:hypothetical protein